LKKGVTILLLACLFLNTGGYWLYIKCIQIQRRNEVRAQLRGQTEVPGEAIFEFALKNDQPADPSFESENEHEFYFQGKLYDIIEQQVTGGKLRIRCIEDEKEEGLLKKMEQVQDHQQQKKGSDHTLLQQLIQIVFVGAEPVTTIRVPVTVTFTHFHYQSALLPAITEVTTPPPRA
jgi:hypothetical protein